MALHGYLSDMVMRCIISHSLAFVARALSEVTISIHGMIQCIQVISSDLRF
jgi:hypothetical protein